MTFIQSLTTRSLLPSTRDLENFHLELQNGLNPEFEALDEETTSTPHHPSKLEQHATNSISWPSRTFSRSPKTINAKREGLLSGGSAWSSSEDRESQVSTLLELEREEEPREKGSSRIDARVISDAIIGLSDGLTVPFALTAGLSALGNTKVVIFAGLAELTAGAISMGLGGYLGAKSEE